MRVHVFQHVPFEGPGCIADWASERGHTLETTHVYETKALPAPADVDFLVVMGGPMSVNDESNHPWLASEKAWLNGYLVLGRPTLGICLGAQLIANTLGAEVKPGPQKEIGWFPLQRQATEEDHPLAVDLPETFTALHWHGETFDLPHGATRLASTDLCTNQAFAVGNHVMALQFHFEATAASTDSLIQHCADELKPGVDSIQTADAIRSGCAEHGPSANALMFALLDQLEHAAHTAEHAPA